MESKFKLSPPWFGPFIVHERINNTYRLRSLAGDLTTGKFHTVRLKKFIPDETTAPPLDVPLSAFPIVDDSFIDTLEDEDISDFLAACSTDSTPEEENSPPNNVPDVAESLVIPLAHRRSLRAAAQHHQFIPPR